MEKNNVQKEQQIKGIRDYVEPDKCQENLVQNNEKERQEPIDMKEGGTNSEEVHSKGIKINRVGLIILGVLALVTLAYYFFPRQQKEEEEEMTSPGKQPPIITKNDVDTVSFMLGYSLGMQIVKSKIGPPENLNMDQIIRGIQDAGAGVNDIDYEQFQRVVNGYLEKRDSIFSDETMSEVIELCKYVPDHGVAEGSERYLTKDFYRALSEAFAAPVNEYYGIGEDEWLYYLFSYQDGSPKYDVKSINRTGIYTAKAVVNVVITGADGEVWGECGDYEMSMALEDGKWIMSDFGGFNQKCKDYVKDLRKRYKTGEIIKEIMSEHESEEEANECVSDFKKRLEEFYNMYGR